jgi:hypothetical protein
MGQGEGYYRRHDNGHRMSYNGYDRELLQRQQFHRSDHYEDNYALGYTPSHSSSRDGNRDRRRRRHNSRERHRRSSGTRGDAEGYDAPRLTYNGRSASPRPDRGRSRSGARRNDGGDRARDRDSARDSGRDRDRGTDRGYARGGGDDRGDDSSRSSGGMSEFESRPARASKSSGEDNA